MRIAAACLLLLGLSAGAWGHEWYPLHCCSGRDCKAVSIDDLVEQADGSWKYLPKNLTFTKDKVHPSKDRHMHVCIGEHSGLPLCAFVLQGS